jgi:hypothetical protein
MRLVILTTYSSSGVAMQNAHTQHMEGKLGNVAGEHDGS